MHLYCIFGHQADAKIIIEGEKQGKSDHDDNSFIYVKNSLWPICQHNFQLSLANWSHFAFFPNKMPETDSSKKVQIF